LKGNVSSRAQAEVDAVRQRITTLASDLQTAGRQQLRTVEERVAARPLLNIGIIFAAALLLGRLLYRR
jgi:ElaB/YqjD/DUF883 family membrane-anchored ribosome-binding protein